MVGTCSSLRQAKEEGGPLAGPAVGPHPPTVLFHDAPHVRQPDARALELVLVVQALEDPEVLAS